jgi:hypothetical protein
LPPGLAPVAHRRPARLLRLSRRDDHAFYPPPLPPET